MTSLVQTWNMALGRLGTHQFISSLSDTSTNAGVCRAYYDQARRACLADYDWPFAKVLIPLNRTSNQAPPPWDLEYVRPECIRVRGIAVIQPPAPYSVDTVLSGTASYIDFGGPILQTGGPAYQGQSQPFIQGNPSPTVIPFTTGSVMAPVANILTLPPPPPMGSGGSSGQPIYESYLQPGGVTRVIWTNAANAAAWCTIDVLDPNGWEPGFVNAFSWFLAKEIALEITGSASVQEAMASGAMDAMSKASAAEGNEETQIASWNADWIDARDGFWGGYGYGRGGYGGGY